jgi:DNA-binding transcriptional regulator YhcF (GntR family)
MPERGENEKSHLREPVHIPSIELDRGGVRPLHRQIRDQIAASVRKGAIPPGTRLPATRVLAAFLGVSRNTVLTAYEELVSESVMQARRGSGVRVTGDSVVPRFEMEAIAKTAHFTGRQVLLEDSDGNPIAASY